jgi:hypothetical protein
MMLLMFLILFSTFVLAGPCEPHEIYIREQNIESYYKTDGTHVSSHTRKSHCRELSRTNYFKDSTTQKFKDIKTKIKKWSPEERNIIHNHLGKIPEWLKKYVIAETLRADTDGTENPASSIALTKTLILFDRFFQSPNKTQILAHEVAHLTVLDLTKKELEDFYTASGWTINRSKGIKLPPKILVMPDSDESVVEDYANHVEMYHYKPNELKRLNPKSFIVIEAILKMRGHK